MPFSYFLPVPRLDSGDASQHPLRMVRHLVAGSTWIEVDTPIAVISAGEANYEVLANGPGILHEFLKEPGSHLSADENIAIIHADGESIPYGKPYSKARRI